MQNSLTLSNRLMLRAEKNKPSQTNRGAHKNRQSHYWLIGGGIITLPVVVCFSLLQWIVKQNWTMLPL
ncbi:MAG: hypothetical protein U0350_04445 [Caldilineaceae bacterium]